MFVIAVVTPSYEVFVHGPFATVSDAEAYMALHNFDHASVVPLYKPE